MKYYLLGLIFTDGNLDKFRTKITLSLTDKDLINILYPYYSDITKRKIYHKIDINVKHADSYILINTNKECIKKLIGFGITENKSLTLEFPNLNSKEAKSSFMRGVFDGDGSVYKQITKNKSGTYTYTNVSFTTGSKKFAEGIIACLKDLGIHSTLFTDKRKSKRNETYYVYIRTKDGVKSFYDLIYNNNTKFYSQIKKLKYLII